MIAVYKIQTCSTCKNVYLHFIYLFTLRQDNITRGHSLKLVNSRCHQYLRKFSFSVRIVNIWSSLPASVNSANNVNKFKNRLDRFWTNQELMYDYKNSLTGIGNRSSVDSFDDTIFSFIIMLWICSKRQKWGQCVLTLYLITQSVWICIRTNCSRKLFAWTVRANNSRQCEMALMTYCVWGCVQRCDLWAWRRNEKKGQKLSCVKPPTST